MSTSRRARRVLWEGSIGAFGLDTVELPNATVTELAVLEHPGAAAVVPFVDTDHVLLLRQYRHAAGETLWEIPAGKLDPGESPETCAVRELEEETGYRSARLRRLGSILTAPAFTDERIHLFSAHELSPGTQALESHEVIDVRTVRFARALEMVSAGDIVDAKTIVALLHAARA